jgi:hypothetical protein
MLTDKIPDFLIVVPFVTEQILNIFGIALDQRRGDLAIVFPSRRYV